MLDALHTFPALIALLVGAVPGAGEGALEATYAWNLSDTSGALRSSGVALAYDRTGRELYVVNGGHVSVFNGSGMEVYSFGDDARLGGVRDVAAVGDGDLLLLSYVEGRPSVIRCNFRGEPLAKIALKVPAGIAADFFPNTIAYAKDRLYLADRRVMRVVVTDLDGELVATYDLASLVEERDREGTGIYGFSVDQDGRMLFTIQPHFRAYVVAPDGRLQSFGTRGSGPGKFNVVGPIVADERGYIYVGDLLKSAVLVFNPELKFVREFGRRGNAPGSLVLPSALAAGDGKVFVSQYANRGVSVFRVAEAAPPEANPSVQ